MDVPDWVDRTIGVSGEGMALAAYGRSIQVILVSRRIFMS